MGKNYEQGVALFQMERYRDAVSAFSAELVDEPQSGVAFAMRAASWLNAGQLREASNDVSEALSISPNLAYAHYVLSCVCSRQGKSAAAEQAAREAIRLSPDADYFCRLAEIQFIRSLFSDSLQTVEEGLSIAPNDTSCLKLRAQCLAALGRQQEAKECLRAALSYNPEDAAVHRALGKITLEAGQAADARDSLREARRLNPVAYNDRNALAIAYGSLIWPLSVFNRIRIRYEYWPVPKRWRFLASTATGLLIVSFFFHPWPYIAIPIFLIAFNVIATSITFDMLAIAIGKIVFMRDLDIRWYRLLPESFRLTFPFFYHLFISAVAIGCALEPTFAALFLGFAINFELLLSILRTHFFKQVAFALLAVFRVFLPIGFTAAGMSAVDLGDRSILPAAFASWAVSLGFSYLLSVRWR